MKQWIVRAMLVVLGIWLGAVLLPGTGGRIQRQAAEVTAGARERAALWAASQTIGSMRVLRCLWSFRASCLPFSVAAPLAGAFHGPLPPIFSRRRGGHSRCAEALAY